MCWFNYLNFQMRYVVMLLNDFIWKNKRVSSKDMFLWEWILTNNISWQMGTRMVAQLQRAGVGNDAACKAWSLYLPVVVSFLCSSKEFYLPALHTLDLRLGILCWSDPSHFHGFNALLHTVGFSPSFKINMPLRAPFGVLIGGMDLFVRNYTHRVNPYPPKKKNI